VPFWMVLDAFALHNNTNLYIFVILRCTKIETQVSFKKACNFATTMRFAHLAQIELGEWIWHSHECETTPRIVNIIARLTVIEGCNADSMGNGYTIIKMTTTGVSPCLQWSSHGAHGKIQSLAAPPLTHKKSPCILPRDPKAWKGAAASLVTPRSLVISREDATPITASGVQMAGRPFIKPYPLPTTAKQPGCTTPLHHGPGGTTCGLTTTLCTTKGTPSWGGVNQTARVPAVLEKMNERVEYKRSEDGEKNTMGSNPSSSPPLGATTERVSKAPQTNGLAARSKTPQGMAQEQGDRGVSLATVVLPMEGKVTGSQGVPRLSAKRPKLPSILSLAGGEVTLGTLRQTRVTLLPTKAPRMGGFVGFNCIRLATRPAGSFCAISSWVESHFILGGATQRWCNWVGDWPPLPCVPSGVPGFYLQSACVDPPGEVTFPVPFSQHIFHADFHLGTPPGHFCTFHFPV